MPLAARVIVCTVLVVMAGLSPVAWLVASEQPSSLLGQWSAGVAGVVCFGSAMVFGNWRPAPPHGFPVEVNPPPTGA